MAKSDTRGVRPFSRDRLALLPRDEVAKTAFAAMDKVQQQDPTLAVAAVSVLFLAWCKRLGVRPEDMTQMAARMIEPEQFHQKANLHMDVIRDFAGMRVLGDSRVEVA